MSYWNQNSGSCSQLDELLSKDDVTLREVIEEPEVLQECKLQNKKLTDFLSRPDVLRELIYLTTKEPPDDNEEAVRYKYANIACELLTSELPQIIQALACEQFLLDELYAFLEADAPLNPLLASFFSRIMGVLISKISEQNWFSYQVTCLQVLEFLKSKGNFVPLLLRHIGTSAIMDLILKMYTKIEGADIRDNFLTWLNDCEFLEQLIGQLNGETSSDTRSNVCQLLCDLVMNNRENVNKDKSEDDPILKKIESDEFVKRLLGQMLLEPRCEGSIVGGVSVLLTLLGSEKKGEQLWEKPPSPDAEVVVETTITTLIPYLKDFVDILHKPPTKPAVRTTVGVLDPPLGATRVEIARLLAALVATGHEALLEELQRQDLLNVLLNLFFRYPWNNFLHIQVEVTIGASFNSTTLVTHVLLQCKLLQRILDAWRDNDEHEKAKKPRRGYMGHVIRISNLVVSETSKPPFDSVLAQVDSETLNQWKEFVSTDLAKVNGDQISTVAFKQCGDGSENEQFYHQLYRSYLQLQELTPAFQETFFDEPAENLDNDGDGISGRDLKPGFPDGDSERTLAEQEEIFNKVCKAKLGSNMEPNVWNIHPDNKIWDENSSDEEFTASGDDEDEWMQMAKTSSEAGSSSEQNNPWSADVLTTSSPPDQGWANFESSPFLANFGYDLSSTIATSVSNDMDREPFDLTPTEASMPFPSLDDATNDLPQETEPSPADVNKNLTDDMSEPVEIAQVIASKISAEIVSASDIMTSRPDAPDVTSSCLPSSTAQPVMAAFTPETVIQQTDDQFDTSALPLPNPSEDVAKQLNDLLAQVSLENPDNVLVNSSENRTISDTNNEDTKSESDEMTTATTTTNTQRTTSSPIFNNSINESSKLVSTPDNDDGQQESVDLVPNVPTSMLAVSEGSCEP